MHMVGKRHSSYLLLYVLLSLLWNYCSLYLIRVPFSHQKKHGIRPSLLSHVIMMISLIVYALHRLIQSSDDVTTSVQHTSEHEDYPSISIMTALRVPGVIPYSICLFFSKLVAYAFIFWLPYYLKQSAGYSSDEAGNWSVIYDVGGVLGGIIAGYVSDRLAMRGVVSFVM